MPHHITLAPNDKGASDKVLSPHSELQTQLSKHQLFHERVKSINAALRRTKIVPADPDAHERSREVIRGILEDERLVEMYLRQLWQVGGKGRFVVFPPDVLTRNGRTIISLKASIEEASR